MGIGVKYYRHKDNSRYVVRRVINGKRLYFTFKRTREGLRQAEIKDAELVVLQKESKCVKKK